MGFRLIGGAMALMGLTACGGARSDYPALMPTDQILAEPAMPAHAGDAADGGGQPPAGAHVRPGESARPVIGQISLQIQRPGLGLAVTGERLDHERRTIVFSRSPWLRLDDLGA